MPSPAPSSRQHVQPSATSPRVRVDHTTAPSQSQCHTSEYGDQAAVAAGARAGARHPVGDLLHRLQPQRARGRRRAQRRAQAPRQPRADRPRGGGTSHLVRIKQTKATWLQDKKHRTDDCECFMGVLNSDLKTFINTCIAFLGSGVLGLPYAFRQCGVLIGFVTLVGVAAASTYAMMLVVQCKYKLKQQGKNITKYGEIGYFAMGHLGSVIVNSALVISQTGFCIACKDLWSGF
ncbi:unnamed protein product [Phytophthora lilii]|uniref:Unnamed protein product n=1 Tax=Phytophthora lilii TaxID=2077276 RepID=A0A9W6WVH9_9STRA|nr:unnamed protein product [Phytophthora lilii]